MGFSAAFFLCKPKRAFALYRLVCRLRLRLRLRPPTTVRVGRTACLKKFVFRCQTLVTGDSANIQHGIHRQESVPRLSGCRTRPDREHGTHRQRSRACWVSYTAPLCTFIEGVFQVSSNLAAIEWLFEGASTIRHASLSGGTASLHSLRFSAAWRLVSNAANG